jgi:hypothetical protein
MLCLLAGLDPDLDRGGVSPIKPPFSLIAGRDEPLPTRSNTPEPSRAWSWWEDIPPHDQVKSSAGCVSTLSPLRLAEYLTAVCRRLFRPHKHSRAVIGFVSSKALIASEI